MKWTLKNVKVSELKEYKNNPRTLTDKGIDDLKKSIKKFGVAEPLVVNTDMVICGGHGRKKVLDELKIKTVDVYIPDKKLTEKQFKELNIRLNKNIVGEWDFDMLADMFEIDELKEWGFEDDELQFDLDIISSDESNDKANTFTTNISANKTAMYIGDVYGIISKELFNKVKEKYDFKADDEEYNGKIFEQILNKII